MINPPDKTATSVTLSFLLFPKWGGCLWSGEKRVVKAGVFPLPDAASFLTEHASMMLAFKRWGWDTSGIVKGPLLRGRWASCFLLRAGWLILFCEVGISILVIRWWWVERGSWREEKKWYVFFLFLQELSFSALPPGSERQFYLKDFSFHSGFSYKVLCFHLFKRVGSSYPSTIILNKSVL